MKTKAQNVKRLSLTESENGNTLSLLFTGENQSLQVAVDHIRDRVNKPITFADDVDRQKVIPEFSIEIMDGDWNKLLDRVAAEFGCEVTDTDQGLILKASRRDD